MAQKISFPPSSQIKAGGALDPAEFPAEIRNYAGQQLHSGDKARVYANEFIGIHLTKVANGQTYSQASAASLADPKNATLAPQANTLIKGETLRGLLLNAWGWSQRPVRLPRGNCPDDCGGFGVLRAGIRAAGGAGPSEGNEAAADPRVIAFPREQRFR